MLVFPRNCEFTTNNRCRSVFGARISSRCSRRSCERNIDRAKRTSVEVGSTIQIDSYSASLPFLLSFSSFSLLFYFFLNCIFAASTMQYRSICFLVRLDIRPSSSMSLHSITHSFCNFFSFTNHGKQSRKQSCKALMFHPTAVKHFNLFNSLSAILACRFASQAFQRCGGSKFRMNFPEMLNAASINGRKRVWEHAKEMPESD